MTEFWQLLRVECLKLKRTLALLTVLACPAMVVLLNTGMLLKNGDWTKPARRQFFWSGNLALWAYFMLPLFIALVTALLNQVEHKNAGWRLMLCLPVSSTRLFFCKTLVACGFVGAAHLCLWGLVVTVNAVLQSLAPAAPATGMNAMEAGFTLLKIGAACLPVLVLQHALSWRVANVVAPLALGICATMGVVQIGSSQYWVYFPWSYPLMAGMGGTAAMQQQALLLAAATAAAAYGVAHVWAARRAPA